MQTTSSATVAGVEFQLQEECGAASQVIWAGEADNYGGYYLLLPLNRWLLGFMCGWRECPYFSLLTCQAKNPTLVLNKQLAHCHCVYIYVLC